jgi:1,4-dihydroxy-2-naphthoyl-CoA hydrolase
MSEMPWMPPGEDLPAPLIPLERSFEGFLDLEWVELTEELAHVRLEIRENLKQPLGLLHGGIYSAVAETIASVGTVYAVWKAGCIGVGMRNSANFLRPVTSGTLDAISRRRGATDEGAWLWSTDFTDDQGRLCALVDVTVAVRPRPDAPR